MIQECTEKTMTQGKMLWTIHNLFLKSHCLLLFTAQYIHTAPASQTSETRTGQLPPINTPQHSLTTASGFVSLAETKLRASCFVCHLQSSTVLFQDGESLQHTALWHRTTPLLLSTFWTLPSVHCSSTLSFALAPLSWRIRQQCTLVYCPCVWQPSIWRSPEGQRLDWRFSSLCNPMNLLKEKSLCITKCLEFPSNFWVPKLKTGQRHKAIRRNYHITCPDGCIIC